MYSEKKYANGGNIVEEYPRKKDPVAEDKKIYRNCVPTFWVVHEKIANGLKKKINQQYRILFGTWNSNIMQVKMPIFAKVDKADQSPALNIKSYLSLNIRSLTFIFRFTLCCKINQPLSNISA